MADRKARLAELRKLKETAEDPKANHVQNISFRNYDPLTNTLSPSRTRRKECAGGSSRKDPGDRGTPTAPMLVLTDTLKQMKQIEKDAKELLEKQVPRARLWYVHTPRKPGFDLARDLERRMEKLEKRTNYAIAENIRKRFKDSHDISEVADVNQEQEDLDEDDD
ncbi:hypothetical protein BCR33DRAFT_779339 [Rhizoclosmatium globosum]|uniref:Uncharacterized protein n=1 Tax=Rhizoclosmatium globosum TaxID=329046 RepID=A0A1Y2D116_9FUNG|nr:hypothetical protein BCR33DRAFT_779339 [Rhizoclosmatium globosum]|eukprot:ORY52968.1 hypothetical protein BCR33DRAFT_779339 [Rhizoclosmatium globosum]